MITPAGLTHQKFLIYLHILMFHKFVHIKERIQKKPYFSSLFEKNKIPFNQPNMLRTLWAALTALTLVNLLIPPAVESCC